MPNYSIEIQNTHVAITNTFAYTNDRLVLIFSCNVTCGSTVSHDALYSKETPNRLVGCTINFVIKLHIERVLIVGGDESEFVVHRLNYSPLIAHRRALTSRRCLLFQL